MEIVTIQGEPHEVVEWTCTDPPGPWNDDVGSWTLYARPVKTPKEGT